MSVGTSAFGREVRMWAFSDMLIVASSVLTSHTTTGTEDD